MRRIKELLTEYEIRFKETDEILESSAFNDKNIINKKNYVPQINELRVSNKNGQVYDQKKGWATAKLTEKPGKWVIERNENHPMWVEFMAWWNEKYSSTLFNEKMVKYIQNNGKGLFELVNAENHQYLTLDQWAEFFLNEPKEGDWGIFWNEWPGATKVDSFVIMTFEGEYLDSFDCSWKNFKPFSSKLQEMLNKEIDEIK